MNSYNPNFLFLNKHVYNRRVLLLQGGTRSGKTYSTLQWIIRLCYKHKEAGMVISICRKTIRSLKGTVMRDFFEILKGLNFYNPENHNKTDHEYNLFGNLIEFLNLDDEQKIRGRKRHIAYVNEANENEKHTVRQLAFRTSGKLIFDYNPSIDEEHWLLSDMLVRDDSERIITNYLDNPFLSKEQVKEIERLKDIDEEAWKVFGLGELGNSKRGLVFQNWDIASPPDGKVKWKAYGLDFGYFPDPSALIEAQLIDGCLYLRECFYLNHLTPNDLVHEVSKHVGRGNEVFCDHRPELIEMLYRSGINAKKAIKGDIDAGIRLIKQFGIFVDRNSLNLHKELRNYSYLEDKNGDAISGKYIDKYNHLLDSARYAVSSKIGKSPSKIRSFSTDGRNQIIR